ncbi:MAG TPA: chemotaxis-specific protein-glutamate methyltransferase CheB [Malonomonas sp.]
MTDKLVRVLVVDDSAFSRVSIGRMLETNPNIQVVGYAVNGEEGLRKIIDLKPDVVTLDLEMPRMGGFGLLRMIMQNNPVAVIVVSAQNERQDVFKALEFGAVDFISKPARAKSSDLYAIQKDLVLKVLQAAELTAAKLRRRVEVVTPRVASAIPAVTKPLSHKSSVVLIGSSTGGPPALHSFFSSMKEKLPVPIAVAQHMPSGFTKSFALRLNEHSPMDIKEAEDGDQMFPGRVLICPGGKNIELQHFGGLVNVRVVDPPDRQIYTPSVDVLFRTGAYIYGSKVLGVVLTGMGNDGASGVREIHNHGGRILAEAEESCVVYGMPKEAINTGYVEKAVLMANMLHEVEMRCKSVER